MSRTMSDAALLRRLRVAEKMLSGCNEVSPARATRAWSEVSICLEELRRRESGRRKEARWQKEIAGARRKAKR